MIDIITSSQSSSLWGQRPTQAVAQADLTDSLDYQILRRTLNIEEPDVLEQAAQLASQDAGEVAVVSEVSLPPSTDIVARVEQNVQQSQLQLEVRTHPEPKRSDPLVLDLRGQGLLTTGIEQGVLFDLDADGRLDQISSVGQGSVFVALDRNGNGVIDDGRELFGDQNGAANGFAELARFDDNADGVIDSADAVFSRLKVLSFDAQGRQQLRGLAEVGVAAIQLNAQQVNLALGQYDRIAQLGSFSFADGRQGVAADLLLAHR